MTDKNEIKALIVKFLLKILNKFYFFQIHFSD